MAEGGNPIQGLRAMNAALGTIVAQHEAITKFESIIAEEYINAFAPDKNGHSRAIRRVLERIMWQSSEDNTDTPREEWLKNLRSSAREIWELKNSLQQQDKNGAACDGSALGCTAPHPSECAIHSVIYKRMMAAVRAYNSHGGEAPAPDPENATAPGESGGIVIPIPGGVAEFMGLVKVPDGSGGAVSFRRAP